METYKYLHLINVITKGDTRFVETLFNKPGGRKHLESIVLIMITQLPYSNEEKSDLFVALLQVLNKLEKRIKRQEEGKEILKQMYN